MYKLHPTKLSNCKIKFAKLSYDTIKKAAFKINNS